MTPDAEARIIALLEQLVAAAQPRPALMTADDVSHDLSVSVRTVHRLQQLGQLPAPVRVGTLVRWRRAEIEAHIAESRK
jgi:excisionase family DNA binding protein